ncbi:hypothetical protein A8G00_15110 [Sphingobium sp. SA916]|nr:hypothetical protein A8G00_15110 [Sphingobium sp. SA916]
MRIDQFRTTQEKIVILTSLQPFTKTSHHFKQLTMINAKMADHIMAVHQIFVVTALEIRVESLSSHADLIFVAENNARIRKTIQISRQYK